ncbi:hypothetical protein BDZ97DRAFT_1826798 [Flammula alnicola]|nr:hypothetical protein BDZ97DRAFT_1826798 [Flammula alnicola]
MATLTSTAIDLIKGNRNWTATQEKSISQEYPFQIQSEPLDQYVARTYLQFLWLPEMAELNTITLPQILADGGGAGEMEETMMWYALAHEKADESISATLASAENAGGPWVDEKWRERVQIQILLYFYKLSLPGLPPQTESPKKKRKRSRNPPEPTYTAQDHLEVFMDRLSTWQLVGALDHAKPSSLKNEERDWTQVFVEDVVERQFTPHLPELCSLLHSKVFPTSPFLDDEVSNAPTSRNPSPEPMSRALSRAPSTSRLPSPALSTASRATTKSKSSTGTRALVRSRSRSLSAYNAPPKKRILNREVSMSRVFKPKAKPKTEAVVVKTEAPHSVKLRVTSTATLSFGQPSFAMKLLGKEQGNTHSRLPVLDEDNDDDGEEEWMMDSSPDIMLLNPTRSSSTSSDIHAGQATPTKPSRARRR